MSAAAGLAALAAFSTVDGELSSDGSAWNVFLMDGVGVGFEDVAAALGTGLWQRRVEDFVDAVGLGSGPMCVGAVLIAGFASGFTRLLFRRPFGEGSGLPFGSPLDSFDTPHEFGDAFFGIGELVGDALFEFGDATITFGELPSQIAAVRTRGSDDAVHAGQLSETTPPQLQEVLPSC